MRTLSTVSGVLVLLVALCGCNPGSSTASSTPSVIAAKSSASAAPTTAAPVVVKNSLKGNSAHHLLPVDGEKLSLKVDYWTTTDTSTWQATGTKDLHLAAYAVPDAGATLPEVVVDDFGWAFTLMSTSGELDGAILAAGHDRPLGSMPGFVVTATISYASVITAVGTGQDLVNRWAALGKGQSLTDSTLAKAGAYGVQVTLTYGLLVRYTSTAGWHRRTVIDVLTVPIAG